MTIWVNSYKIHVPSFIKMRYLWVNKRKIIKKWWAIRFPYFLWCMKLLIYLFCLCCYHYFYSDWLISIPLYFSQSGVRLYTFPRNDTHKSSTVLWTATSFGVKYFGRPIFSQNWFRKLGLLTSTSKPEVIWLLLRNEKILFLPKLSVHCSICKLKMILKIKLLYIYYNFANLGKFQVKFL